MLISARSLWILVLLSVSGAAAAAAPPAPQAPGPNTLYLERSTRDLAELKLSRIAGPQIWVVARVRPSKWSGGEFDYGVVIDPRTGKGTSPPGAHDVTRVYGTLQVLWTLVGSADAEWLFPTSVGGLIPYKWEVSGMNVSRETPWKGPLPSTTRSPLLEWLTDGVSPYLHGGSAVIRINPVAQGAERFYPTYLIPQGWEGDAAGTQSFVREYPDLFKPDRRAANTARLTELLRDPGAMAKVYGGTIVPMIRIAACQVLASTPDVSPALVEDALSHSTGVLQGVYTLLFLKAPYTVLPQGILHSIERVIQAGGKEDLQGIRLAATLAVGDLEPPITQQLGHALLSDLDKKAALAGG